MEIIFVEFIISVEAILWFVFMIFLQNPKSISNILNKF